MHGWMLPLECVVDIVCTYVWMLLMYGCYLCIMIDFVDFVICMDGCYLCIMIVCTYVS
jgi:hypothetical protein